MGLLDSNPMKVVVVDGINTRLKTLADFEDFTIKVHEYAGGSPNMSLGAVWQNIAVWFTDNVLYISNNGLGGDITKVDFVSSASNFPGLITDSWIKRVMIVPYNRRTTNTTSRYNGKDWRLVVFTSHGQIYHNFPSQYPYYLLAQ